MQVFVVGVTGRTGRLLARDLLSRGDVVRGLVRDEQSRREMAGKESRPSSAASRRSTRTRWRGCWTPRTSSSMRPGRTVGCARSRRPSTQTAFGRPWPRPVLRASTASSSCPCSPKRGASASWKLTRSTTSTSRRPPTSRWPDQPWSGSSCALAPARRPGHRHGHPGSRGHARGGQPVRRCRDDGRDPPRAPHHATHPRARRRRDAAA